MEAISHTWHVDNVQFNYPSASEFESTIMIILFSLLIIPIIFVKQKKKK